MTIWASFGCLAGRATAFASTGLQRDMRGRRSVASNGGTEPRCDACRAPAKWRHMHPNRGGGRLAWCELHFRERVLTGYSVESEYRRVDEASSS